MSFTLPSNPDDIQPPPNAWTPPVQTLSDPHSRFALPSMRRSNPTDGSKANSDPWSKVCHFMNRAAPKPNDKLELLVPDRFYDPSTKCIVMVDRHIPTSCSNPPIVPESDHYFGYGTDATGRLHVFFRPVEHSAETKGDHPIDGPWKTRAHRDDFYGESVTTYQPCDGTPFTVKITQRPVELSESQSEQKWFTPLRGHAVRMGTFGDPTRVKSRNKSGWPACRSTFRESEEFGKVSNNVASPILLFRRSGVGLTFPAIFMVSIEN